jgi:hypothetical protein
MTPDEQGAVSAENRVQLLQRLSHDIFAHSRGLGVWHASSVQMLTRAFKGAVALVQPLAQAGRSRSVDNNVVGDAPQPRSQLRLGSEATDPRISATEHFLGQVLAVRLMVGMIVQPPLDKSAQRLPLFFVKRFPHLTIMSAQTL